MKILLGLLLLVCSSVHAITVPVFVYVKVREQKLNYVYSKIKKTYPVSTSKYGLGDRKKSYATPLGLFQVVKKIGDNCPVGAVFHHRVWRGQICAPNTPGRDPIITRIIWLRGLEKRNENAYWRGIYIHGTTEEKYIGRPASYGCIRMKSKDIIDLYNRLPVGAIVQVE